MLGWEALEGDLPPARPIRDPSVAHTAYTWRMQAFPFQTILSSARVHPAIARHDHGDRTYRSFLASNIQAAQEAVTLSTSPRDLPPLCVFEERPGSFYSRNDDQTVPVLSPRRRQGVISVLANIMPGKPT